MESFKESYSVVGVAVVVSAVYFYMTGEAKTLAQKQKLQNKTIKDSLFVGLVSAAIVYVNSLDNPMGMFSDNKSDIQSISESFTPGPADF